MKKITKGFIAIAMVGILQIGFAGTLLEAAPRDDRPPQKVEHRDKDLKRQHDQEMQKERERHEQEMKRRPGEDRHQWEQRKREEDARHKRESDRIAALLIGIVIGNSL